MIYKFRKVLEDGRVLDKYLSMEDLLYLKVDIIQHLKDTGFKLEEKIDERKDMEKEFKVGDRVACISKIRFSCKDETSGLMKYHLENKAVVTAFEMQHLPVATEEKVKALEKEVERLRTELSWIRSPERMGK